MNGGTLIKFRKSHTTFHVLNNKIAVETEHQFFLIIPRNQYCKRQYLEVVDLIIKRRIKSTPELIGKHQKYVSILQSQKNWFYGDY